MKLKVHLCNQIGIREPAAGHECMEAINTQGRSCRKCEVDCYRRGWSADVATADNKRLVAEKRLRP